MKLDGDGWGRKKCAATGVIFATVQTSIDCVFCLSVHGAQTERNADQKLTYRNLMGICVTVNPRSD